MRTAQKFYTRVNQKKMNCTTLRIFQYLINRKKCEYIISNIEMDKNSLSCSRVSARLVVHQIAELQLTAPLQKIATKFYNQAPIFPPD